MTAGQNERFLSDSLRDALEAHLVSLGWMATNQVNLPVEVIEEPLTNLEELKPNKVAVSMEDRTSMNYEMGSDLKEFVYIFGIDVFAENKPIGMQLAGDVSAFFEANDNLPIYDLSMATPDIIFYVDVDDVRVERNRFYENRYQKYWWAIGLKVVRHANASSM